MTNNNFSFSLENDGIHINNGGQKFLVSYEETTANWSDAKKWAQEQGGDMGTVEQLRILAKYRDDINAELQKSGKKQLGGWYWTTEEYYHSDKHAYLVLVLDGNVNVDLKKAVHDVRAVSAL